MAKKTVTIDFTYEKDTKNKVRFKEQNDPQSIGILYLTKKAYDGMGKPQKLTVEITEA